METTTRHIAILIAVALQACQSIELQPPEREGSTLPAPDMTRVSVAFEQNSNALQTAVISGTDGAVGPGYTVRVRNSTSAYDTRAIATPSGSFVAQLDNTRLGDVLAVSTEGTDTFSSERALPAIISPDAPPPAMDIRAHTVVGESGILRVTGKIPTTEEVLVRVGNTHASSTHVGAVGQEFSTTAGAEQKFDVILPGEAGDTVVVHGISSDGFAGLLAHVDAHNALESADINEISFTYSFTPEAPWVLYGLAGAVSASYQVRVSITATAVDVGSTHATPSGSFALELPEVELPNQIHLKVVSDDSASAPATLEVSVPDEELRPPAPTNLDVVKDDGPAEVHIEFPGATPLIARVINMTTGAVVAMETAGDDLQSATILIPADSGDRLFAHAVSIDTNLPGPYLTGDVPE